MHELVQKIRNGFVLGLPGKDAQAKMVMNRRQSVRFETDTSEYRKSAVAIHLFEKGEDLELVLIQRPLYDGHHGGQMALPGGKVEEGDASLEHTARRESREEVGISENSGVLLGELTDVIIPVSKYIMTPFVFFHSEKQEMTADPREVDEIVMGSVNELRNASIQHKNIKLQGGMTLKDVPYFDLSGKVVWGATSMVLSEFRDLISKNG